MRVYYCNRWRTTLRTRKCNSTQDFQCEQRKLRKSTNGHTFRTGTPVCTIKKTGEQNITQMKRQKLRLKSKRELEELFSFLSYLYVHMIFSFVGAHTCVVTWAHVFGSIGRTAIDAESHPLHPFPYYSLK